MSLSNYFWSNINTSAVPSLNDDEKLHANNILRQWFPLLEEFFKYKFFDDKADKITISTNRGNYEIQLKTFPFDSKEVKVKVVGRSTIIVEGRHKKKEGEDEVSEYLFKKFIIPEGYDVMKTKCELSANDILIIIIPQITIDERNITIRKVDGNKKKLGSKL